MSETKIGIIGHGGSGSRVNEFLSCLIKKEREVEFIDTEHTKIIEPINEFGYSTVNYEKFVDSIGNAEFNEQRLYDIFNKMANVRYEKPKFRKCKSCGYLVVEYQLDKDDICEDCRKVAL